MEEEPASVDRERALSLCEHALSLIATANDWTDSGEGARVGHWNNVRFRVALLEPGGHGLSDAYNPYVLEIWDFDVTVLLAHWEDPRDISFRIVKPGDWQMDFLEAS